MTRFEMLKYRLWKKFFECPECNGIGGEKDVILDDGTGPWYPCEVCNEKGYMNPFKKIQWKILCALWERKQKKEKEINED